MRSVSLRKRLLLAASLVLIIALGLVGLALNQANHRGAVSALRDRMESYVYLVLAAMEVGEDGRLRMEAEFTDPRLTQPTSGIYIQVRGRRGDWNSESSLAFEWPPAETPAPGRMEFSESSGGGQHFELQYAVGWQLDDGRIEPFTVRVLVDRQELTGQTSAFRLGLWRALGAAGVILVLGQVAIFFFGFRRPFLTS